MIENIKQTKMKQNNHINLPEILTRFFYNSSHLAIVKDSSFRYVCINKPLTELLGLDDANDAIGKTDAELLKNVATKEQMDKINQTDRKAAKLPSGKHVILEVELTNSDGEKKIFLSKKFPIRNNDNELLGIGILTSEISDFKKREKSLLKTKEKLADKVKNQAGIIRDANENLQFMQHVFQNTLDGIIITDDRGNALQINPAFTEITGYTLNEIRGENPRVLKSNYHSEDFYREMWTTLAREGSWEGELWNRRKSGEIYPQRLSISAIHDSAGNITHYVGVNNDISELKRKEEKIQFYAYHDALTNLPNRKLFSDRLRRQIENSKKDGGQIALLYLDLDDFKKVNDSSGYNVGDDLLIQLSARIKNKLDDKDLFARLGSDEFAIALVNFKNLNYVTTFAQSLKDIMQESFLVGDNEIFINFSIGISIFPEDTDNAEQLILHADTAMHQVKDSRLDNFRFYTAQMKEMAQRKIDMDAAIRKGLAKGEFVPFYQAKVSCKNGRVTGMEALARWKKEDGEIVNPDTFIPLAEELNLIHEMDLQIISQAVRDIKLWEKAGFDELIVSANISAKELDDPEFANEIFNILKANNVAKNKLELEITESMLMNDVDKNAQHLEDLCTSGVTCSIDDFGTGYSSLSYLKKLPIKTLKIDRSFVRDILNDKNDLAIVCAIISMARHMGLTVVAEGVEERQQAELLAREGCDIIQGYYYSKPIPQNEFYEFLKAHNNTLARVK